MVFEIAKYNFWPSGLTPAVIADTHRLFFSTLLRSLVLSCVEKIRSFLEYISIITMKSLNDRINTYALQVERLRIFNGCVTFLFHLHIAAQRQIHNIYIVQLHWIVW